MLTERLEVRTLAESDRARFVQLLMDPAFMVFSNGTHTLESAGDYFDHLLALNAELAFAKQPIVVRSCDDIVGYAGVDWFELRGRRELEFGYRLVPEARGFGYATEASVALLKAVSGVFDGTIFAIVHPTNEASLKTANKLGFEFIEQTLIDGDLRHLFEWRASFEMRAALA
jgi:RimJ/RimL family protein N-acetyltransferase